MRTAIAAVAVVAVVASLAAGCASSSGYEKSQDTAGAMKAAVDSATAFSNSRQAAFDTMNTLTAEPLDGLPAKFQAFSAAVDTVVSSEASFRTSIAGMKSASASRFEAWKAEDATYTNPAIQARSQQRRGEAQDIVNKASADADAMLVQAANFTSYLSDLRKLLSNDLTPKGVAGISDLAGNARASNGRLHQMAQPTIASLTAASDALATK
jgi:PBP1b-binding outer membrane lipoprotein LpoB